MGLFGVVEPEGVGDAVEDAVRDSGEAAAFDPRVVLDTHAGEQGDLFAAEAGDAASAGVDGQADVGGGEPGPSGLEELAQLGASIAGLAVGHGNPP